MTPINFDFSKITDMELRINELEHNMDKLLEDISDIIDMLKENHIFNHKKRIK